MKKKPKSNYDVMLEWKIGYWYEFILGGKRIRRLVCNKHDYGSPLGLCVSMEEGRGVAAFQAKDAKDVIEIGPDARREEIELQAQRSNEIAFELMTEAFSTVATKRGEHS